MQVAAQGNSEAARRLGAALDVLDGHVAARTFIAGERLSVADIAAAAALRDVLLGVEGLDAFGRRVHLRRWYETVVNQPCYVSVLREVAAEETARDGAARGAAAAGGGGGARYVEHTEVPVAGEKATVIPELFARRRVLVKSITEALIGRTITVGGWVKTSRVQAELAFVELSDGSCAGTLQLVCDTGTAGFQELRDAGGAAGTGASVEATGELVRSPAKGQAFELKASKIRVVGTVVGAMYETHLHFRMGRLPYAKETGMRHDTGVCVGGGSAGTRCRRRSTRWSTCATSCTCAAARTRSRRSRACATRARLRRTSSTASAASCTPTRPYALPVAAAIQRKHIRVQVHPHAHHHGVRLRGRGGDVLGHDAAA